MLYKQVFILSLLIVPIGYINNAFADSAEIMVENMTSVQIHHPSVASVLIMNKLHPLLPDHYEKITVPTNTPITIKLNSLSFEDQFMDPSHFYDCSKTVILQNGDVLNMYLVGKVPEGTIECRYY